MKKMMKSFRPVRGLCSVVHTVELLATETTGALTAPLLRLYRRLARNVSEGLACDNTVYGLGRASPQSFLPHHTAALSAAVVEEDARAVCSAAASLDARETGRRDR